MKATIKLAAAAIIGVSALTVTASDASARVACNRWGECWRVGPGWRASWGFPASAGVVIRPASWRAGRRVVWRGSRSGRGFWRRGVWVRI